MSDIAAFAVSAGTCEVTAEAKSIIVIAKGCQTLFLTSLFVLGDFAMGTFHAQLAKALLAAVEEQQSQQAIIKVRCVGRSRSPRVSHSHACRP